MNQVFTELALGIGAAVLLAAYFVAFSTSWPSSYFSLEDVLSRRISVSWIRYALFRFAPVVILTAFVAVVSSRLGGRPVVTALMAGGIHDGASAGRGFISHYRRRELFARRSLLALSAIVLVGVLVSAGVGGFIASRGWMMNLVPEPNELRSDLWTALFAAILGAAFVKATSGRGVDVPDLVKYARRQLGTQILDYARSRAEDVKTDPALVEAILLVESLQRPKWLRGLEQRFGRLLGLRTYGPMQVTSDRPLTDEESIDRAVENYLVGVQINPDDYDGARRVFEAYNQNPRFVELAQVVYDHLKPQG